MQSLNPSKYIAVFSYKIGIPNQQRDDARKDAKHAKGERCHFDRREKSLLDPSHSFGMTGLGPSLCALASWRENLC